MNTVLAVVCLLIGVCLVVATTIAVWLFRRLPSGTERYTISTSELPNIAADIGGSDRGQARR